MLRKETGCYLTEISAVIPANNEMNSIAEIVRGCRLCCREVIVVDDGSIDHTAQVAEAAGAVVIRNRSNIGIVATTEVGLRSASGDVIVTLDADGQHDPSEIPRLVRPIAEDKADLVLGSRSRPPLSERMISRLCSRSVKCEDVGTGYRAFSTELAHEISLWGLCLCGSLVVEAQRPGARIAEIPIHIKPRRYGASHWASPISRGTTHCKQAILIMRQMHGRPNEHAEVEWTPVFENVF